MKEYYFYKQTGFNARERKERQGRNPRKPGEVIQIPAATAPVFKAGKALKDAVNK